MPTNADAEGLMVLGDADTSRSVLLHELGRCSVSDEHLRGLSSCNSPIQKRNREVVCSAWELLQGFSNGISCQSLYTDADGAIRSLMWDKEPWDGRHRSPATLNKTEWTKRIPPCKPLLADWTCTNVHGTFLNVSHASAVALQSPFPTPATNTLKATPA